ncbi:opioid-binding protein/cell adhesion molecule homolog isoform X2 [Acipenser ruthenus]|uniref:opioid-binding protein/cell adhesion molecule homolog isoform X2 n=1 Tax=Acipenser ruthenus TaxID=7906 RepID=UPI00145ACCB4|nr:opioid-binding protein/cell adhesion molecule homolog isoform X2 [Acipenser ruthenus]
MNNPICWVILIGMTILFLQQGVPVQSGDTSPFNRVMDNLTVRQGDSVLLRCAIDNQMMRTAWLNRSTILFAGRDKWTLDERVSLQTYNNREYTIKINNVQVQDEGLYTCAVQTNLNPRTTNVHLIVQVPPTIVNISSDVSVNEGANVSIVCLATGKPEPVVTWRHLSPIAQGFLSEEEYLEIPAITKQSAGVYECSASNEVSTDIKKVQVIVNFPPYISNAKNLGVAVGQKGILRCEAIAVPTAAFEWYIEDRRIFNGLNGIQIQNKGRLSMLTFFNVSEEDYGNYTCMATNKLGNVTTSLILYETNEPTSSTLVQEKTTSTKYAILRDLGAAQDGKSSGTGIHASAYLLMILCVQLLLKF